MPPRTDSGMLWRKHPKQGWKMAFLLFEKSHRSVKSDLCWETQITRRLRTKTKGSEASSICVQKWRTKFVTQGCSPNTPDTRGGTRALSKIYQNVPSFSPKLVGATSNIRNRWLHHVTSPSYLNYCWLYSSIYGSSTPYDLVGGWPTPLKNDGVRQLILSCPTEWKNHPFMFQTTNQKISMSTYLENPCTLSMPWRL